ncbi:MAG: DUF87 domain-containing protein [Euryarchaeota archaeon]|nr:DUF87 domain-containing protein [Euryarchaeota archaeon]
MTSSRSVPAHTQVGVIYGTAESTLFEFAVTDPSLRRLDYVSAETPDGTTVLAQVLGLRRESSLSFDQALSIPDDGSYEPDEKVSARATVVGYRDERDLLQVPRVPFRPGGPVMAAPEDLIQRTIGFRSSPEHGAYLGVLKGTSLPVSLHINTLVQKHVSVLAKTGAGKSYCTGVLLEELLKKDVAVVIVDAHDEYHSLKNPNIDPDEVDRLIGFGLKPKAFADKIDIWSTEMNHRSDTKLLRLEGTALGAAEILDLAGSKLSGAQQGVLYQAIKDARNKNPLYSLRDIIDQCHGNKSNSKWNVISGLEALDATGLFADDGVPPTELVQKGRASIVSLKGVPPDIQEVIVARLATLLFESRKGSEVPPFLFVVEEAHNYCPERGIGNAVSLGILRTIASEGRKFGMGLCVVSQRPAKVDKNVLSQCNTQIILKVTNPNDLKAIVGSVEGVTSDAADEIARLPVGVAMVAGAGLGMPVLVEVRTRQSRHGGGSVDVVGGKGVQAVPRMKPATPDPDPEAVREVKRKERETRSSRRIEWGEKSAEPVKTNGAAAHEAPEPVVPVREAPKPEPEPEPEPVAIREVPRAEKVAPAPEPERREEPAEPRDVRIHRVANRVGYVATLRPEETMDLLRKAAARAGKQPASYLEPLAKVGRSHCRRDAPDCLPCPLAERCAYKAKLDAKSVPEKGVLGRFFGKR